VLLFDDRAGVIAADVEKWDALVVSVLATRVLAVSYQEHLVGRIEIRPCDTTYLLLAHCGCNSEPNDATQRNLLSYIAFKGSYEPVKFILRWPPVSFDSLPDEAESPQSDSCQIDALRRKKNTVHGCSVREDRLDIS
jgi:hypothetical protein